MPDVPALTPDEVAVLARIAEAILSGRTATGRLRRAVAWMGRNSAHLLSVGAMAVALSGHVSGCAKPAPVPPPIPVPPAPVPPVPPPVPPTPPLPPAPIPGEGLRVLMLYDSKTLGSLPPAQLSILYAGGIRDYLNARCAPDADGKSRSWRIWDAATDATAESPTWQAALKRPHASLPWVILSNGKSGYEGPLPATVDATLDLLRKWGG